MDLGFRKEGMVTVRLPEYEEASCEALRSEWLKNPRIQDISFAWSAPTGQSNAVTPLVYEVSGDIMEYPVHIKMTDKRYLDVYEIPLIAGRFFERNAGDESNKQWVVNEAVVRRMGLTDPLEAVGKGINVNDSDGEIIGVIRDFHVRSLHSEIKPTAFFNFWPGNHNEAQIRMDMVEVQHTIDYIRNVWTEYYPEHLFEHAFLDDFLKGLYESESKMLIMIQTASFLAILIGCLGLLGLVSFLVLQRTKEIGIRKVLGATVGSIYVIVSKEFIKWVVVASILAWPIAYLISSKWLQEFAYRIQLNLGYFIIGGLISLGIALLVLSYQVIRAATANPVDSLRYE
jgi:putative ABC transport system permease protein